MVLGSNARLPAVVAEHAGAGLSLIPYPQSVMLQGAPFRAPPSVYLHVPTQGGGVRARAAVLAKQFTALGVRTQVSTSGVLKGHQAVLTPSPSVSKALEQASRPLRGLASKPEGYRLTVNSEGALLHANDENGFYWAGQTLRQFFEDGHEAPGCTIEDAPLLSIRGLHLDFRGWAPTPVYLEHMIDRLSCYKFNVLVLEYEQHFAYNSQPGLSAKHALTATAVTELSQYALDRGITLTPLLHCLGHAGYLLRLDPYRELREDPRYYQQFCPCHPTTLEVYSAMAEDLFAAHPGPYFHAGGNDARFLGVCPACQARARQIGGRSPLYLEHIGKVCRYLIGRGKQALLWDEMLQNMTDAQVRWLPPETVVTFEERNGHGGRATPDILMPLDRYRALGRRVWGCPSRWPSTGQEAFDNLDAWSEAAEMGYVEGLLTTCWTREYSFGPLYQPPVAAWPAALYASERCWAGRKLTSREAFIPRFALRFFGLREKPQQERLWGAFDLLLRDFPREARECIQHIQSKCTRGQEVLAFLDAICRLGAFEYYLSRFEEAVAHGYANFQSGQADPFHAGRLRWRIEDLKSRVPDVAKAFRNSAAPVYHSASEEEFLNGRLAYGLSRLDQLSDILEPYPLPDKDWQQPARI